MYANVIVQLSKRPRELFVIFCDSGLDTVFCDSGLDTVFCDGGLDTVFCDGGLDTVFCDGGLDTVFSHHQPIHIYQSVYLEGKHRLVIRYTGCSKKKVYKQ